MKIFRNILYLLAAVLCMTACSKDLLMTEGEVTPPIVDNGINQMVLFSSGNDVNSTLTTRATAPYMETAGRFVCTMYFHGKAGDTDTTPFDVEDANYRSFSYMKVFDVNKPTATGTQALGNSVYWKGDYSDVTGGDLNDESYKTYGFDPRVEPFYWKNRLNHVFVAYTDYNKLKTITPEMNTVAGEDVPVQGSLFMYPEHDGNRNVKTGETVNWIPQKTTVMRFERKLMTLEEYNEQKETSLTQDEFDALPSSEKYVEPAAYILTSVTPDQAYQNPTHQVLEFGSSVGFYGPVETLRTNAKAAILAAIDASTLSDAEKNSMKADMSRTVPTDEEKTINGTFHNSCWTIYYDQTHNIGYDAEEQPYGTAIDLADAATTVFFSYDKKKITDIITPSPANTFDLTRKDGMNSINDQPDPILAVTKMKPTGATQESNRVRLLFKHQFAQVQVNVQKIEDTTADLQAENILSVELLGVTKQGYVFTLPNEDGEPIAPAYDLVDVSKLNPTEYQENPYGTAFNMFNMGDDKPSTALKSFNAIAFGELRALRITWKEPTAAGGTVHKVVFPVDKDERGEDLRHLQSGKRYVYDIKLSRGMLASIRVLIEGWKLSKDLNYRENGIISN